jgi:hypothetical protein
MLRRNFNHHFRQHLTRLGPRSSSKSSPREICEREGRICANHVGKPGTDALRKRCESRSALSKGRRSLWGLRLTSDFRHAFGHGRDADHVLFRVLRHSKRSPDLGSRSAHDPTRQKVFLCGSAFLRLHGRRANGSSSDARKVTVTSLLPYSSSDKQKVSVET